MDWRSVQKISGHIITLDKQWLYDFLNTHRDTPKINQPNIHNLLPWLDYCQRYNINITPQDKWISSETGVASKVPNYSLGYRTDQKVNTQNTDLGGKWLADFSDTHITALAIINWPKSIEVQGVDFGCANNRAATVIFYISAQIFIGDWNWNYKGGKTANVDTKTYFYNITHKKRLGYTEILNCFTFPDFLNFCFN